MINEETRFAQLFKTYVDNQLTDEELQELMHFITLNDNLKELQILIDHEVENAETTDFLSPEKADLLYEKIVQEAEIDQPVTSHKIHHYKTTWWTAAAIALILVTTGTYLLFSPKHVDTNVSVVAKNDVRPGGNKAVLTLADGSTIVLNNAGTGKITEQGNTKVLKVNEGELTYQTAKTSQTAPVTFNTLSIPRGGQYQLTLPDGSKVWLNSATSITFPTAFTGKDRRVQLTGEAYFEVTKNPSKPFIVSLRDKSEVRVLGTHFNINAYNDDSSVKTTLLEGRVQVSSNQNPAVILTPGTQASLNAKGKFTVAEVDTEAVVAWKNGLFMFNSEDIETIMMQISRWYDVEVVYPGNKPDIHLSGIISRNVNVSSVLKMLEISGVKFKVEGKKITVLP